MKLDLTHTRSAVLGLARSGLAAARLLRECGAEVFASDAGQLAPEVRRGLEAMGVEFEEGGHTDRMLASRLIVVSPGIRPDLPILVRARRRDIEIIGEAELAFRAAEGRIIAVTGTNGKSTTVSMIGAILEAAGQRVLVGGNLAPGRPLCQLALESTADSIIAAEISTFQIEYFSGFRPRVGVVTNISPDHLDRHPDFASYARLKGEMLKNQTGTDWAVLNRDDENVQKYCGHYQGRRLNFSLSPLEEEGAWWDGKSVFCKLDDRMEVVMEGSRLKVPGRHNISNALAAAAAAVALGIPTEAISRGLSEFHGVPHRLEQVGVANGVSYVNNSMCTNAAAGISSLKTFSQPVIVIIGGKEKNTDLSEYLTEISRRAKAAIAIGECRERLAGQLKKMGFQPALLAEDMDDAVAQAARLASPGDVVLLSPGCASFDMFRDFEDRGRQFAKAAQRLEGK